MASRDEQADSGRKGAPSKTKAGMAYQMTWPNPKGEWAPAYGGGMGAACDLAEEVQENE